MSYTIVIVTFTLIHSCLTLVSSQSFNDNNGWLNNLQNQFTSTNQAINYDKLLALKYANPNLKSLNKNDNYAWLYDNNQPILYGKRESGSRLTGDLPPPPPGFVGSRGRRAGELMNGDNDIRSKLINKMAKSMGISPLLLIDRLRQNESKKKDLLPYKDAFMGSRG